MKPSCILPRWRGRGAGRAPYLYIQEVYLDGNNNVFVHVVPSSPRQATECSTVSLLTFNFSARTSESTAANERLHESKHRQHQPCTGRAIDLQVKEGDVQDPGQQTSNVSLAFFAHKLKDVISEPPRLLAEHLAMLPRSFPESGLFAAVTFCAHQLTPGIISSLLSNPVFITFHSPSPSSLCQLYKPRGAVISTRRTHPSSVLLFLFFTVRAT